MQKIAETPLMLQYMEMKKKHPDAILLFRVGDFYETFSDDAIAASEILGITLTRRANGKAQSVELAGFPHHALDAYLPKLVRAGRRVAICEQLEDPKLTKKLVKRGITELVTPGVNTSPGALQSKENNFLAAVYMERKWAGVAFLDISTGEFLCAEGESGQMDTLLSAMAPKEVLRMKGTKEEYGNRFNYKASFFELDDWVYTDSAARERLLKQFSTSSLKGFGVHDMDLAIIAAGSILHYLDLTSHSRISHITSLARIDSGDFMRIDPFTVRNLELIDPLSPDGRSLLAILDKTSSPIGARKLRRWILQPLLNVDDIYGRLNAVEMLVDNPEFRDNARSAVSRVGDMERLVSRVASAKISPREMRQLSDSVKGASELRQLLLQADDRMAGLGESMPDVREVSQWIDRIIVEEAPSSFGKGEVIAQGIDNELDELRGLRTNSRDALHAIQERESATTGITSLKVHFNNVFGYYIEVRNTHKDKVPSHWIRKQTLVNAERYITPELKEYEEKISGAEEKIAEIEARIYAMLLEKVATKFDELHRTASAVATADCLISFADVAEDYNYVKPEVDDSDELSITDGRHPVIERTLPPGESYVANSVELKAPVSDEDTTDCQIMMITGPNMSGKSALLRQTALITLMAQIGSFVPAKAASIGVADKIFTRVGASDSISSGESTFMVEMNEAASILNNMTSRSLILFDELGRGTSTYDGISIAWAIVEYIHNGECRPRTLFATHYHELNEMASKYPHIANFNVAVSEIDGKVVFIRKLRKGGSEHSFGIHVAKLAGLPRPIINRANQVLRQLEEGTAGGEAIRAAAGSITDSPDAVQMSFFQLDDPLLSQIRDRLLNVNVNNLTPLQALNMLNDLQGLLTGK